MKTLLVDDEQFACEDLADLIGAHCPNLELIGAAHAAAEARKILLQKEVDLIFLDLEMPGEGGLELLRSLPDYTYQVVFVTAFPGHAREAINASANGYLLKPVDPAELVETVNRMFRFHETRKPEATTSPDHLVVNHAHGFDLIELTDILYLQAHNSYTIIHLLSGQQIIATRGIASYEKQLFSSHFFRVHKSYLVNLRHLKAFLREDSGYVVLSSGLRLEVARRRRDQLMVMVEAYANRS